MTVILTESDISGFVALGFPDESGGIFGSQVIVGIHQCNMIVKYELKGYAYQSALPEKQ